MKELDNDIGIYIIHAKKGYEYHEQRIKHLFNQMGLNFEFVTDGDPSLITSEIKGKYFTPDIQLRPGILSCTLNHIFAYERMVNNKNRLAIIFENDPFFLGDFMDDIQVIIKEASLLDNFIISLENTCLRSPSVWQTKKGKHIYRASMGRAAGAYLIDSSAAKSILHDLHQNKCHTVIDWWHNSLLERNVIKMYWAFPALVEQGSHNGLLSSVISTNNKSTFRRIEWFIHKLYKNTVFRLINDRAVIE